MPGTTPEMDRERESHRRNFQVAKEVAEGVNARILARERPLELNPGDEGMDLCHLCDHWRNGDCHHEDRDCVDTWGVPTGECPFFDGRKTYRRLKRLTAENKRLRAKLAGYSAQEVTA